MSSHTAESISKDYDFTGKTAIVTGASAGIGKETARVLALKNAHVILAVRSVKKGEQVKREIIDSIGKDKAHLLEVAELDLNSLASVREFAKKFQQRKSQDLHFLVNNAGIFGQAREQTVDGFEAHFGVNHLGHFLLTLLLLPNLKKSAPSRVVVVASTVHQVPTEVDFNDYNLASLEPFDPSRAYNNSKLYNVLFANELNRRLEGTGISANSLHPGLIETDIIKVDEEKQKEIREYYSKTFSIPILSPAQGAATTLFVIGSKEGATGGQYFDDSKVATASTLAQDPEVGRQFWELSEKLTSATFPARDQ